MMYFTDQRDSPNCPRTYLNTNIDVNIFLFHIQENVKLLCHKNIKMCCHQAFSFAHLVSLEINNVHKSWFNIKLKENTGKQILSIW